MADEFVLVTGGTGFIAQHCILALLNAGDRARPISAPIEAGPKRPRVVPTPFTA